MFWRRDTSAPYRRAKYLDWFGCLDADGSGRVEQADVLRYADRIAKLQGWSPDDGRHAALVETLCAFWSHFRAAMDEDGDGVVVIDEFLGFFTTLDRDLRKGRGLPTWATELVQGLFLGLDLDGDGCICVEEYSTYLRALGVQADAEAAAAAFATLDLDGDGKVCGDELVELFRGWVCGQGPGEPGNLLLTGREPSAG